MANRRFESSMMEPFNDWIELSTAARVAALFREIVDEMNHDTPDDQYLSPVDTKSCQCTALRVYAALDHFIRGRSFDLPAARAILRDGKQNVCGNCVRYRGTAADRVRYGDIGGGSLNSEVKA